MGYQPAPVRGMATFSPELLVRLFISSPWEHIMVPFEVPAEWMFEGEGSLRGHAGVPGLERLRDGVAGVEGIVAAALVR